MAHDAQWFPPPEAVYQQTQRRLKTGVFEAMVHALRVLLRLAEGRNEQPSAANWDGRTLQSTPENDPRAGYDSAKRKQGSKVHMATYGGLHLGTSAGPARHSRR